MKSRSAKMNFLHDVTPHRRGRDAQSWVPRPWLRLKINWEIRGPIIEFWDFCKWRTVTKHTVTPSIETGNTDYLCVKLMVYHTNKLYTISIFFKLIHFWCYFTWLLNSSDMIVPRLFRRKFVAQKGNPSH